MSLRREKFTHNDATNFLQPLCPTGDTVFHTERFAGTRRIVLKIDVEGCADCPKQSERTGLSVLCDFFQPSGIVGIRNHISGAKLERRKQGRVDGLCADGGARKQELIPAQPIDFDPDRIRIDEPVFLHAVLASSLIFLPRSFTAVLGERISTARSGRCLVTFRRLMTSRRSRVKNKRSGCRTS